MQEANEELREKIVETICSLRKELEGNPSKTVYRTIHQPAVRQELWRSRQWIEANIPKLQGYFADGEEVNPQSIEPELIEVSKNWHSDLYRLARYTWSLPYTKGYGRRLRFILIDRSNEKLIGILGLQSPPLDFSPRDQLFNYPINDKVELVNQTMDIFTLGAVPPYNSLLGGKLVALAATSNKVRQAYERKYKNRETQMENRKLPARLVALTTTSAFGKSSIYNRLRYGDQLVARPIGYTKGYGSFHLTHLYPQLRKFLEEQGISTRGGYGVGPRIVWQTFSRALSQLGLSSKLLKHGIKREAYLFPMISNIEHYMNGQSKQPQYFDRKFTNLVDWWRCRWLLPRAERVDGWHTWKKDDLLKALIVDEDPYSQELAINGDDL